jgi:hypothetical protein
MLLSNGIGGALQCREAASVESDGEAPNAASSIKDGGLYNGP